MCVISYGDKEAKYPINTIIFSNELELRYWIIDGNYHIALWYDDNCIVEDNNEPISTVLKDLVKIVHEYYGAHLSYVESEKTIKRLENYIETLKEKLYRRKAFSTLGLI